MTYHGEASWKSFLVKFTRLVRSQQKTEDEQHNHFCLSPNRVASGYYTLLMETSPNLRLRHFGKFEKRFVFPFAYCSSTEFPVSYPAQGRDFETVGGLFILVGSTGIPNLS
jgi:hypothetical protein